MTLSALHAAGLPFESLDLDEGFKRHSDREHAHLWIIANAGTGRTGRPWLQVSAGNPKEVGGVDKSTFVWCSWRDHEGAQLDPAELAEVRAQAEAKARDARARKAREQAEARTKAAADWEAATTDGADRHAYLTRKGVGAYGVKVSGETLLVPVRDTAGTLHGLQTIGPDGGKRFGSGTAVAGHYHLIGTPAPGGWLYLCEGYATAATVHEAKEAPAVCAFNGGNLPAVAKALKAACPTAVLIVAGDDDTHRQGNPGRTHAEAAARSVGAPVVFPRFKDGSKPDGRDWNDLGQLEGIEAVRVQLEDAADPIPDTPPPREPDAPGATPGPDDPRPGAEASNPLPAAPTGWSLTEHMVFEVKPTQGVKPDEYVPVCGYLRIIGRTNGPHRDWGLMLSFKDHDGTKQRAAIPAARLHEDPAALARELATQGLRVVPGKEKRMLAYLDAWEVETRILSAKRLGWMEDPTGALSFVLPDRVIARGDTREVVFQPERYSPTVKTVHASGTLEDWQIQVAAPACAHSPMVFALAAGLAPAFLAFAEAGDSFVLHFYGKTSRGKTTEAQLAASPWGCAADPNDAPSMTFVRRWNLTGNGLEGLAEAHSDLPLVLDELGASTVGDIRPLVYQLSGGQGKTALNSAREMKEPRAWRTIAISTGELSLHAKMSDPDGTGIRTRTVKGGLTHRALDVELTDIAASSPEDKREPIVSGIKTACARYYGTAGPELIRLIVERFSTATEVRAHVRERVAVVMPTLTDKVLPTETARAVRRFALISVAGEFAAEHGLLPASVDDVRQAVKQVVGNWLAASAETDDTRVVAGVRGFILRHAARFQPIPTADDKKGDERQAGREKEPVKDRVGWVNHADSLWMFTDAGLTEAAPGNDKTTVARVLRQAGFLFTNETGKLRARVTTGEGDARPWLYAVKGIILDGEESGCLSKTPGQPGQPGQSQQPQGLEPVPVSETAPGQPGQDTGTGPPCPTAEQGSVPPVPVGTEAPGQPQSQQPRGVVPPVPPVPPETRDSRNIPAADRAEVTL